MGKQTEKATKRRENGDGSVFFRESKGLWCSEVTVGVDANGKRKRKTLYGKTKADVLAKLKEIEASVTAGTYIEESKLTVSTFLDSWLLGAAKQTLRPTTYERYRSLVSNHITPELGNVALTRLMPLQLQALYSKKLEQGLSPRSVQFIHSVLRKALSQALKWGYVTRNVAQGAEPPKPRKQELVVFNADQVGSLMREAKTDRLYALYVLAVSTGMRQGELLGLSWDDVDLKAGRLYVRRSLQELNGKLVIGEVKTRASRRMVTLPTVAVMALREHLAKQTQQGFANCQYVFTDTDGGPIRKQNLVRRSFKPLLKRAGLPDVRFHDLRHTHATLLLMQGTNPKLVQERLGHASIGITLDTYSHVLPNMQEQVANQLDTILNTD